MKVIQSEANSSVKHNEKPLTSSAELKPKSKSPMKSSSSKKLKNFKVV